MKLPRAAYNRTSYLGAAIAVLAFLAFVFLVVLNAVTDPSRSPYAGLVIFILIPAVLLFGLLLIPVGMLFHWRRYRTTGSWEPPRLPVLDLNKGEVLNALLVFSIGSIILLFASAFGSYEAYEYTDSVSFCGTLCHTVMQPEHTTYRHSPHARVACVECHVGPGAGWYVRSKLSGAYQVYSVTFKKYPRPIATPIHNLRPARQTCEQCHWPEQFFGGTQRRLVHFLPDEKNTRWEIDLLVKTGGGSPETSRTEGVHWHIANRVEYVATDDRRQKIPWVRKTDLRTGQVTVYKTTEDAPSDAEIARSAVRTMDCMDCHNRPTHIFRSPTEVVNLGMAAGTLDPRLTELKSAAVPLLASKEYSSVEQADKAIESGILNFYRDKYPEIAKNSAAAISQAITTLKQAYQDNFFPYMKARWDAYPNDVGHFLWAGCYRCHDGSHKSAEGQAITANCTACHTILAQGEPQKMTYSSEPAGLTFQHPQDIGDLWQETKCNDCHTGELP
jgi:hypothetical protein